MQDHRPQVRRVQRAVQERRLPEGHGRQQSRGGQADAQPGVCTLSSLPSSSRLVFHRPCTTFPAIMHPRQPSLPPCTAPLNSTLPSSSLPSLPGAPCDGQESSSHLLRMMQLALCHSECLALPPTSHALASPAPYSPHSASTHCYAPCPMPISFPFCFCHPGRAGPAVLPLLEGLQAGGQHQRRQGADLARRDRDAHELDGCVRAGLGRTKPSRRCGMGPGRSRDWPRDWRASGRTVPARPYCLKR